MKAESNSFDILVLGGGPIGLTQGILLAQNGFKVAVFDANKSIFPLDDRTTALNIGSQAVLARIGLWDAIEAYSCPINHIDVLDGNSPVLFDFNNNQADIFGWVIQNKYFKKALFDLADKQTNLSFVHGHKVKGIILGKECAKVTLENGKEYTGNLLIGADGRQSFSRKKAGIKTYHWDYKQTAIVLIATHENPHNNKAIEHFHDHGPFAVLPMISDKKNQHQSAIIWTIDSKEKIEPYLEKDVLKAALAERMPKEWGDIIDIHLIHSYPLSFHHAYTYIADRFVLVGDAAHGLHPVAAQGLNLGIKDVDDLTNHLIKKKEKKEDYASLDSLKPYEKKRRMENSAYAASTDAINHVFSSRFEMTKFMRKKALKILQKSSKTKRYFTNKASGTH